MRGMHISKALWLQEWYVVDAFVVGSAADCAQDDVVSKPFRISELLPKIEQLIMQYGSAALGRDVSETPSAVPE